MPTCPSKHLSRRFVVATGTLVPELTLVQLWLAATIAGKQCGWRFDATQVLTKELLSAARQESVVAIVDWRLQQNLLQTATNKEKTAVSISPDVIKAFTTAAREEALVSMLIESETRRVLGLMANARITG